MKKQENGESLHNGELHNLYSSPDIIRQIKSRKIRWAENVARMGGGEMCTGFCWETPKGKDRLKDQGVDRKMGSKWILGRSVGELWSAFIWLRIETVGWLL
jgi:hypothetical protein